IITIMVLELKVPEAEHLADLQPLIPKFISYVLSFIYVGIYWNNHHHTLQVTHSVSSGILWANLHLLFWLSLLPFTSGLIGENHFSQQPMLLYGFNLLLCAGAYTIFARALIKHHGHESLLARAFGKDRKGNVSLVLYIVGIALTFINPWFGFATYVAVALIWLVPDRRMQRALQEQHHG
ncbi:MAG TPA: TMEM175 family protein, partial [Candidatus Acidoferrum sp.]|nr:TMEM175 family protein [Candidatus Acidoferrum sp.]